MINQRSGSIRSAVFALTATLLMTLPAFAGFKEDVARDLGTQSASLVAPAPTGTEWLIDADANSGVQTGDLFSVIVKGAPVVNPVTKKTIGNIETVKAVLRVTKVKSGYAYAEVISGKGDLKAGEEARRFSGLPAIFWDYAGDGEAIFTQLQGALPDLDWQSYTAAQEGRPPQPRPVPDMAPAMIFVYNDKGLGVKDQTFQPVRFYRPDQVAGKVPVAPVAAASAPVGASIVAPGSPAAAPAAGTLPGNSGSPGMFSGITKIFGGGSSSPPGPGGALPGSGTATRGGLIMNQMDHREGVWYGPRMDGHPVGVEVGDLDGDGKNEIALGFKTRIVVAKVVDGKFETVSEYELGRTGAAMTLDGLDLDGNGRMELYVSVAEMNTLRSFAVEMQNGKLEPVIRNIPYLLRKVSLPGEGYQLLGQELNGDLRDQTTDFSGQIYRLTRKGDRLERGTAVALPSRVQVTGFQQFEVGGRPLIANLNVNDKLQVVDPSGAIVWEGTEYFGGSETSFERPDGTSGAANRYAFVEPRLEPGPEGTVLVPVNEGSRTFSAFRQFNSSHLKAVTFDGYSLVERWRTKPQGGYLGDFRMADADNDGTNEVVMLVMFSHGDWLKANYGNSALLIYEMQ